MKRITVTELLVLHYHLVQRTQGDTNCVGVRDPHALESALWQPFQVIGAADLYRDPFTKASVLAANVITGHPFFDGNKRTGIVAGITFLEINGYLIMASDNDVYDAAYRTASGEWQRENLMEWFLGHVRI